MWRKVVNGAGFLLFAAAIVFVGLRLADNIGDIGKAATSAATWGVVAGGAVVYAVLTLPLAAAWTILLARAGAPGATFIGTVEVFGRSQIAKYIPGNVFHLVGRQLLGVGKGWPQGAVAVSSVVEALAQGSAASATVLFIGFWAHGGPFEMVSPVLAVVGGIAALSAPSLIVRVTPLLPIARRAQFLQDTAGLGRGTAIARALIIYLAFFMAASGLLWMIVLGAAPNVPVTHFPTIAAAFVSAWLIGNVTPSAPGGLGVREALMLAQIGPVIGESEAVVAVITFRLVTILGDLSFFALAQGVRYRQRSGRYVSDETGA